MGKVYPFGSSNAIAISAGQKIAIFTTGKCDVFYSSEYSNSPSSFHFVQRVEGAEVVLTPDAAAVMINSYADEVLYVVGDNPSVSALYPSIATPGEGEAPSNFIVNRGSRSIAQGAPTQKTVSSTLSAEQLLTKIIIVNQGASAASEQQLPLADSLDSELKSFGVNDSFEFSVINISTVNEEDASITTNTGWTLVGAMDIPAYSAAGSLNSSARFLARKTGDGAWTLYRLS